VNIKTQNTH